MLYPPAPWILQGYAVIGCYLINKKLARPFVPTDLEIVSIFPGKTLGLVYVSHYGSNSILEYNELIVAPALVTYGGKIGSWISHIYVDNESSVAGGREIWGLPKELANFDWKDTGVSISQNNKLLCRLARKQTLLSLSGWWRTSLSIFAISRIKDNFLFFKGQSKSQIGLIRGNLELPADSPFARLNLGRPFVTINLERLTLVAEIPEIIQI